MPHNPPVLVAFHPAAAAAFARSTRFAQSALELGPPAVS
jgi:hypothetical protein